MPTARHSRRPQPTRFLAPCPGTPNCVSSQEARAARRVQPLQFVGAPDAAWRGLLHLLEALPRVTIEETDGPYLRAVFRTRFLHFRDDVEFLMDSSSSRIHVRSASRVGTFDFGANRRRVEALRALWDVNPAAPPPSPTDTP